LIARDHLAGALVAITGACAINAGWAYGTGTLSRMGPGFFPAAVGALLVMVGLGIALTAGVAGQPAGPGVLRVVDWRGGGCILLGLAAFTLLGRHGGLMPATFAVVFISAMGDRQNTLASAAILALAMCAICAGVFWWGLRIQMPLFAFG
jgi:hypothetical protein